VAQEESYGVKVYAMARNITVELLSGKVCTLAVRPEMTIAELTEEMKVESGQHVPNNNDVVIWNRIQKDIKRIMDFLLFKDFLNGLVHHIFCQ
jgi:hypothetical protein